MTATVTVTKSGDTIYFRPGSQPGSGQLAEYLNTIVNRVSTVQKATRQLEAKTLADIAALEDASAKWMAKSMDGITDPELKAYYAEKSRTAKAEAARLRGEDVPEPEPKKVAKPVTVVLPR